MQSTSSVWRQGSSFVALALASAFLFQCSDTSTSGAETLDSGPLDGAQTDASASDASAPDAARDATTGHDAAPGATPDATLDASGDTDASTEAGSPSDGATTPDEADANSDTGAGDADAALDCPAIVGALLRAPVTPPNVWLGLDLSNGGQSDGGLGSGALSIDQTGLLACATRIEPDVLEAGVAPVMAGYRTAFFSVPGDADSGTTAVEIEYNLQSREIYQVAALPGYAGQLQFHSRDGGAYGSHTYAVLVEAPGNASGNTILRDGTPFLDDGSNAWANEMYDGIIATFDPIAPAVADCFQTSEVSVAYGIPTQGGTSCFNAVGQEFGLRAFRFYMGFDGNDQVNVLFNFWSGSQATGCATPVADNERMKYSAISLGPSDPSSMGLVVGGLPLLASDNGPGLTVTEANTILGCNGTSWNAPDPGYGGMQWGGGAVAMEYDLDSGVNYKVFAQSGYLGTWSSGPLATGDAGVSNYTIGIGTMSVTTEDGDGNSLTGPLAIDWTSLATATPTVTQVANAWYEFNCDAPPDADCAAEGDCSIVIDDGQGHSFFSLAPSAAMIANNCNLDIQPIAFVFPQGSSVPEQIYVVNPAH